MIRSPLPIDDETGRRRIRAALAVDEAECLAGLMAAARRPPDERARIEAAAARLVEGVRAHRPGLGDLDTFLSEYRLSTREGVALMCLAEALLRIPDPATADRLIRDKLAAADWARHLGRSEAAFVNASTWALMLTGRLLDGRADDGAAGQGGLAAAAHRLAARAGEPVVREALSQAMRIMGRQFVMGRTIEAALERAEGQRKRGWRHSFDMLGEAARTRADAERYMQAYAGAIAAIGRAAAGQGPEAGPGISVKLSALHPRYEFGQRARVMAELAPRLSELCRLARDVNIGLTVDAEEADRLDLSLDVVARMVTDPALAGWEGFGLAVQAYQTRALPVVDWLVDLAQSNGRRLMVRLVKGAYWDTEIKRAQERGLERYPVFTRKASTDVSWLACAGRLLAAGSAIYPQFATHNAHGVAAVREMAGGRKDWEFQRLHGMGEALHAQVLGEAACRIYAPVGGHEDLLPYLVRRLLENGANTSFVNRLADRAVPVAKIVADPVESLDALPVLPDPRLPAPPDLYGPARRNARGWDLADPVTLAGLDRALTAAGRREYGAAPLIAGAEVVAGDSAEVVDPADRRRRVGRVFPASPADAARAVRLAAAAFHAWDRLGAERRADILERAADLYEAAGAELMWLAIREAGKTVADAVGEVREAVDYLRYYAAEGRARLARPLALPGVAGETNALALHGRGVFACISPWNFPLAIFTGQVAAALAAGNAVVAKPAEQTPLIAARAVRLLHAAGVPAEVLHLLPGDGAVGAEVVVQPDIAGVAFTGSTATARAIQRALAAKDGPIVPLIAETGGLNAMVVDSSALPEQVVADVVVSAFHSAGQRCSALRLLLVQDEVFERTVTMLAGAAAELAIGDPALLATDVGPVIDAAAHDRLARHAASLEGRGRLLFRCPLPAEAGHGTFFPPCAWEVAADDLPRHEVFGPLLHVVRYGTADLDDLLERVAATGYGLTLGIHSRVDSFAERVAARVPAGNVYVNRSMIGAVVGAQPFGGQGLSGTGPKAGGPHYLYRFATERTTTINIAAAGGNPTLLAMGEE